MRSQASKLRAAAGERIVTFLDDPFVVQRILHHVGRAPRRITDQVRMRIVGMLPGFTSMLPVWSCLRPS